MRAHCGEALGAERDVVDGARAAAIPKLHPFPAGQMDDGPAGEIQPVAGEAEGRPFPLLKPENLNVEAPDPLQIARRHAYRIVVETIERH